MGLFACTQKNKQQDINIESLPQSQQQQIEIEENNNQLGQQNEIEDEDGHRIDKLPAITISKEKIEEIILRPQDISTYVSDNFGKYLNNNNAPNYYNIRNFYDIYREFSDDSLVGYNPDTLKLYNIGLFGNTYYWNLRDNI
jgi:hypothetical protein